jgi:toxin ParE1/3/4
VDIEVEWSPEASEDLESVAEYIARDSEFYARAVVSKILETSRNVRDFPLIGRMVPETGDERIRERFIYSYRLVTELKKKEFLLWQLSMVRGYLMPSPRDSKLAHNFKISIFFSYLDFAQFGHEKLKKEDDRDSKMAIR